MAPAPIDGPDTYTLKVTDIRESEEKELIG
jgi:hypothetical protein